MKKEKVKKERKRKMDMLMGKVVNEDDDFKFEGLSLEYTERVLDELT